MVSGVATTKIIFLFCVIICTVLKSYMQCVDSSKEFLRKIVFTGKETNTHVSYFRYKSAREVISMACEWVILKMLTYKMVLSDFGFDIIEYFSN